MRATTDLGVLYRAVHGADYDGHDPTTCGCPPLILERDLATAERQREIIAEQGAHIAFDRALPEVARSGQRETSRKAAASIADLKAGMKGVYDLVAAYGSLGLTDEQINTQYPGFAAANGYPKLAPDSPRKRRESLTGAGHLTDSGTTRPTRLGNEAIVWVAVAKRREAA